MISLPPSSSKEYRTPKVQEEGASESGQMSAGGRRESKRRGGCDGVESGVRVLQDWTIQYLLWVLTGLCGTP